MTIPLRTFRRGIHPPANKFTKDVPLEQFPTPERVFVSLSQHIGAPAKAVVAVGDHVDEGQLIGEANGFVSANVFSSVSGTVKSICTLPTATGGEATHIEIENDYLYTKRTLPPLKNPTKDDIIKRVKDAGIVGMGGATFPTHVKLMPKDKVDTLIINGAECEPYITCDYRLFMEEADTVLKGVELLLTALEINHAYIGIEANKPLAIKHLADIVPENVDVMRLKAKYPQGAEKQLIYATTHRIVPTGELPAKVGGVQRSHCVRNRKSGVRRRTLLQARNDRIGRRRQKERQFLGAQRRAVSIHLRRVPRQQERGADKKSRQRRSYDGICASVFDSCLHQRFVLLVVYDGQRVQSQSDDAVHQLRQVHHQLSDVPRAERNRKSG